MDVGLARDALLENADLRGRAWCGAYRDWVDRWLAELFSEARAPESGVSLVAVGGYGRGDLCPHSDLDVLLLHDGRADIDSLAQQLWYPIWDAGLKLGHAVRTAREALDLAATDLDTATSLLTCRHLAGDQKAARSLAEAAARQWQNDGTSNLAAMADRVKSRHGTAGEVAFLLEPDLKEGKGGLRDVHALQWLEVAQGLSSGALSGPLGPQYDTLLEIRVELHRRAGRATDRLLLQEQDALAGVMGDTDADALMARVATAARTIAWTSDDVWERIRRSHDDVSTRRAGFLRRRARESEVTSLAPGIVNSGGEAMFEPDLHLGQDFVWTLRLAVAAAEHDVFIHRPALERLQAIPGDLADPWPDEARELFARLLGAGEPTIRVVETLDHVGLFARLLPEWEPTRSKPQRNAYHRFTVDRHLLEAVFQASKLTGAVSRPDLLVVGALLHDIGKGYPGDHTEVGMELVPTIAARMGYPTADVAILVDMVRLHLLLPDVATRRDLDDDQTIEGVAREVRSITTLELLDALTEADSIATGPAAWGGWKAGLVRTLVSRTAHLLAGGDLVDVVDDEFPTDAHRQLMVTGALHVAGDGNTLTVVGPDRPGLFSRVTGTLALHGLAVLGAQVDSENGMAVEVVRVANTIDRAIPWDRVSSDLAKALDGRLALHARLVARADLYARPTPRSSGNVDRRVTLDNGASAAATVIEVVSEDRSALLFQVTQAMAELLLDIKSARVQTLGADVVDSFYITDHRGNKITDPDHIAEVELALMHSLDVGS